MKYNVIIHVAENPAKMELCYSVNSSQEITWKYLEISNKLLKAEHYADTQCGVYVTNLNNLSRMILKHGENVTSMTEYIKCHRRCWRAFIEYNKALNAVRLFTQKLMYKESNGDGESTA